MKVYYWKELINCRKCNKKIRINVSFLHSFLNPSNWSHSELVAFKLIFILPFQQDLFSWKTQLNLFCVDWKNLFLQIGSCSDIYFCQTQSFYSFPHQHLQNYRRFINLLHLSEIPLEDPTPQFKFKFNLDLAIPLLPEQPQCHSLPKYFFEQ